ncbi:GNAT family protein [Halalkalicoccus salilacus]|uniref:hypothetical protein n=1 Tax=Halalkalicoccus sp. GCM10025704 TaxID=3252662 RepID=UPI00360A8BF4
MIREARSEEFLAVVRLLEGALLEIDPEDVRGAIDRGDVLVAEEDERVRGALVLEESHVESVAVRRRARGRGSARRSFERPPTGRGRSPRSSTPKYGSSTSRWASRCVVVSGVAVGSTNVADQFAAGLEQRLDAALVLGLRVDPEFRLRSAGTDE